jgi:hypothetical protein
MFWVSRFSRVPPNSAVSAKVKYAKPLSVPRIIVIRPMKNVILNLVVIWRHCSIGQNIEFNIREFLCQILS